MSHSPTSVKALVVTGYGSNCERECAHAALQAGADIADIVFFPDLVADRIRITDYNFLLFPGGFLDGDDLGAGQAAALRWRHERTVSGRSLLDDLKNFLDAGGLVLGICNGFQLLVKLGLLPALDGLYFERQVSLAPNDSARFEDRWVRMRANPASPCVFTKGLDLLDMPVRHGEGKLVPADEAIFQKILDNQLVALQYIDPATNEPTEAYPHNPNGSPLGIAGLCDPSGRILGLMPHPEAFNDVTNHPHWTRGPVGTLGVELLARGVASLKGQ